MDSETVTKVAVCLIVSEQVKVRRFRSLDSTLEEADAQVLELFPRIKKNGLHLKLSYKDSLAEIIQLRSDADLQVLTASPIIGADRKLMSIYFFLKGALYSFAEETEKDCEPCM